jgi:hypothetical protein
VIRDYEKEGLEITDICHATNKKHGSKAKSENDSNSSFSRLSGFSKPRTDSVVVGVDDIQDLLDCPINFEYGKPFRLDSMLVGVPREMQRMHSWYTRA